MRKEDLLLIFIIGEYSNRDTGGEYEYFRIRAIPIGKSGA
jgi:hypothetical protein